MNMKVMQGEQVALPLRNQNFILEYEFSEAVKEELENTGVADLCSKLADYNPTSTASLMINIVNDFLDIISIRENRGIFDSKDIVLRNKDFLEDKYEELLNELKRV